MDVFSASSIWFFSALLVSAIGLVLSILLVLQSREHLRFSQRRITKPKVLLWMPHITLLVPCKGLEPHLQENLRPLLEQDYPLYEVFFILEGANDPAYPVIRNLITQYPNLPCRLILSGQTTSCGQKVHNLRGAVEELSPDTEMLAFADSDARPHPRWLRCMAYRLGRSSVGAVTGYRWFVPMKNTLVNFLQTSINNSVASLFGLGGLHLVWGGSWAIRRDVFENLKMNEAWKGTVSDDLVASQVLLQAGYRIDFEPECITASPFTASWKSFLGFTRRQFILGRIYTPAWWLTALCGSTLTSSTYLLALCGTVAGIVQGAAWGWLFAALLLSLHVLHGYRAWIRGKLSQIYAADFSDKFSSFQDLDYVLAPLAGLVHWLSLISSLCGRTIIWRGIQYCLSRKGHVLKVKRLEQPTDHFKSTESSRNPSYLPRTKSEPIATQLSR